MIKIKIKTDTNLKFTIPVPYTILSVGCSILTSKILWSQINKHTENTIAPLLRNDRKMIKCLFKQIIKELRTHKGLVLIDVKSHDGTEIMVRL